MRVLVAAASKYGATQEIAEAIGGHLRDAGLDVDVTPADRVTNVEQYDGVVLGSAVYAGHWLEPAKKLAIEQRGALNERRVWLFSSGPIGTPDPKPKEDPVDAAGLLEATGARAHRVFPGRIDRNRLNFAEKAIVFALRAPDGDFRDWEAIGAWAREIADDLREPSSD